MDEREYWDSDKNFGDDGDEITYEFLFEEPEDIDVLILPKYQFDPEKCVEQHIKDIRKCRNIASLKSALLKLVGDVQVKVMLQSDYFQMQDMAKRLETTIQILKSSGVKVE